MLSMSNILRLNAISSGLTGLLLLLLTGMIAPLMGVTNKIALSAVGGFLVLFAVFVFEVSLGKPINRKAVNIVIALDTAWIIVSAIAMIFLLPLLTFIGNAMVIGVAAWVGVMVYLQKRALRESFPKQQVT